MARLPHFTCLYGEAIRRSFHEGIGSRYDEISGLDWAVPNWNARASATVFYFVVAIRRIRRRNFFVTHEVVHCSIVGLDAYRYAGQECAGKSASSGGQEHLASLCHVGGLRGRHIAPDEFFQRRRLAQHPGLHGTTGCACRTRRERRDYHWRMRGYISPAAGSA